MGKRKSDLFSENHKQALDFRKGSAALFNALWESHPDKMLALGAKRNG